MMTATTLQQTLGLTGPPIAIGFLSEAPIGLEKWMGGAVPAGCVFWREALKGRSFYTVPADHYNCAVGAYTHSIGLPAERGSQLEDTVTFMVAKEYLLMEEVPDIPTLDQTPAYVAYAPLDASPFRPDLVLIAAKPAAAMLIYETALRSGAGPALANTLGRPACAVLPLAMKTGKSSLSLGCMGNRTFTGLPDEELYVCIPGGQWSVLVSKLEEIAKANAAMQQHYRNHKAQFASA
jgi:uncharacterized protein (DUF169 family)